MLLLYECCPGRVAPFVLMVLLLSAVQQHQKNMWVCSAAGNVSHLLFSLLLIQLLCSVACELMIGKTTTTATSDELGDNSSPIVAVWAHPSNSR